MARSRSTFACGACGQTSARWVGRCAGCGEWGTVHEAVPTAGGASLASPLSSAGDRQEHRRVSTGFPDVDRVLGGGVVPGTVALLAGEPGIGKSTLLLQLVGRLAAGGRRCLVVSGEESHAQVADRARRLDVCAE